MFIVLLEWWCVRFLVDNSYVDVVGEGDFISCGVVEYGVDSNVEYGLVVIVVESSACGKCENIGGVAHVLLVDVVVLLGDS